MPGAGPARVLADLEHNLLASRALEEGVNIVGGAQLAAVDGQQVFAGHHVDARLRERRAQARRQDAHDWSPGSNRAG